MNLIRIKAGAEPPYDEWMYKEYGSFEDHNEAPDHVYAILEREQYKPYIEVTRTEAEVLFTSIKYHADGNSWDNALPSDKAGWRGWERRIEKALL